MANEVLIKIKVKDESEAGYAEAMAAAKEFSYKVHEVLDKAADIEVKVETEEAEIKIDEVEEKLHKLDHDDADIKIKVDDDKALAELEVLKHEIKQATDDAGKQSGNSFGKRFTDSLSHFDFKGELLPVGIAIGAALLPLIGGSIAGLVVGGVGLGGIVGGAWIASRDPRVHAAFDDLKKDLSDSLKLDAAPFEPVMVQAIAGIKSAFHAIDLKGIFSDLAPQVTPVLNGVLDMITSIAAGIKNITANSGPVLNELGQDFRSLGRTLEDAFNGLAKNTDGEVVALHDLFAVVNGAVAATFGLVNALTAVYEGYHKIFMLGLPGAYEIWQDKTQKVSGALKEQTTAIASAVAANKDLSGSADESAEAADNQAKQIKSVSDALKAQTDPAFALIDAQKTMNDAQTAYNKAVATGGKNSQGAKSAQDALTKATIGYISAAGAAASGTGKLTSQQKSLLHQAGLSNSAIKQLESSLRDAYNQAKKLDGFRVDVTVAYSYKTFGKPATSISPYDYRGLAVGGASGAADGHTSHGLTWVNERGPELMDLPPGTSVRNHGDSARDIAAAMGGSSGGNPTQVVLSFDKSGLTGLAAALVETIRGEVRTRGGNVQHALGVPGT